MKTCSTCKWHKAEEDDDVFGNTGYCELLSEFKKPYPKLEVYADDGYTIYTHKDFGCTEHEEKDNG